MKKQLLFIASVLMLGLFSQLDAQVVYSEDFDGIAGPTAGGAGTYNFPAGMLKRNVDNLTPNASVNYVNEAWERREDFNFAVGDSAAFSTSWYTPAATSNDWMWTSAITALPANSVLTWNGVTYDPAYPDGYEVRIMAGVAPTGGSGVIGNQITNSTVVFSTAAEATAWTAHSVSLSAYTGQTIYVGFRNNSNDKFLLLIDDIKVEVQVNSDAGLSSIDTAQYTIEPTTQRTSDAITAVAHNYGLNPITNLQLKLNVYDGANALVYTNTGATVASLASNANTTLSAGNYTPPVTPDFYTYEYVLLHAGTDQIATNDTMYRGILVDANYYARDNGTVTGALGIGAGNGGYIGQQYQVVNTGKIDSIMFYVTRGYTGTRMACVIWDMVGNIPNAVVASTDTLLYPDDSARVYTIAIDNGPYTIAPGTYAVTMVEFDSTLSLAQTNDIFRNNTTWVNWPTNPNGTWSNNEDFGVTFSKPYVIRPSFQDICYQVSGTATSTDATCGNCADGTGTVSSNGVGPFTYAWSSGGTTATVSNLLPGSYTVNVTDNYGCVTSDTILVGNNCTSYSASYSTTAASCGACADGDATVIVTNGVGPYSYSWSTGDTSVTASGLLPGNYTVVVYDITSGCSDTVFVNVTFSTGIDANAANGSASLFPNPSTGAFNVSINMTSKNGVDVEVYDALGQIVISEHHAAYTGEVLPFFIKTPGAYTVKVITSEGVKVIPIMINN